MLATRHSLPSVSKQLPGKLNLTARRPHEANPYHS